MAPGSSSPGAIPVVAALLERGGRFLIAQRRNGLWEFPGVKQEPGESPREALAREMLEELGLEVEVGELFTDLIHEYPDKTIRLAVYRCRMRGGGPRCLDCRDWRWASRAEMKGFSFMAADRTVIQRLGKRAAGAD